MRHIAYDDICVGSNNPVYSTIDGDVDLIEPLTPWPWGDEDGKEPVEDSEGPFTEGVTPLTHLRPNY